MALNDGSIDTASMRFVCFIFLFIYAWHEAKLTYWLSESTNCRSGIASLADTQSLASVLALSKRKTSWIVAEAHFVNHTVSNCQPALLKLIMTLGSHKEAGALLGFYRWSQLWNEKLPQNGAWFCLEVDGTHFSVTKKNAESSIQGLLQLFLTLLCICWPSVAGILALENSFTMLLYEKHICMCSCFVLGKILLFDASLQIGSV